MNKKKQSSYKTIAQNKKGYFDYEISDKFEAGIQLLGGEIKSIRTGKVSIKESYARIIKSEAWLLGCHITPFKGVTQDIPDPVRNRKLLLHKREIKKLLGKIQEKGFTLIPLKLYISNRNLAKIELGLAKARKKFDKRNVLKEKAIKRDLERRQ